MNVDQDSVTTHDLLEFLMASDNVAFILMNYDQPGRLPEFGPDFVGCYSLVMAHAWGESYDRVRAFSCGLNLEIEPVDDETRRRCDGKAKAIEAYVAELREQDAPFLLLWSMRGNPNPRLDSNSGSGQAFADAGPELRRAVEESLELLLPW